MPLSKADREIIEAQILVTESQPSYESIKSCLIWPNELPSGLSMDGHTFILNLLAARSYLHRNIPMTGRLERLRVDWEIALSSGLKWIGFKRISIPAAHLEFLVSQIESERNEGSI
jgi:hypothetical protein